MFTLTERLRAISSPSSNIKPLTLRTRSKPLCDRFQLAISLICLLYVLLLLYHESFYFKYTTNQLKICNQNGRNSHRFNTFFGSILDLYCYRNIENDYINRNNISHTVKYAQVLNDFGITFVWRADRSRRSLKILP